MSKLRPLKLPYGEREGRLIHVSQVTAGKQCGCISPLDGKTALIARKGLWKRHHFAARAVCDPVGARETVFHRLAKEILADARCLRLPSFGLELEAGVLELRPSRVVKNLEIAAEQRIADSDFRADSSATVAIQDQRRTLIVEWMVTHACEPAKLDFLCRHRIPSLEIEIGLAPDSLTPVDVREWILFEAPRRWIWHPGVEWTDIRRRGLEMTRRPAYRATRFFSTRNGTKAVEATWVKGCPVHSRIVSTHLCAQCPFAYYVEYFQCGYVDCIGSSRSEIARSLQKTHGNCRSFSNRRARFGESLWYEGAKPNLGSGFRVGWDKPRTDLVPEVAAELAGDPFETAPRIVNGPSARKSTVAI